MVLACIGHWYTDLLYFAPVGLMAGLVGRDKLRTKMRARRGRGGGFERSF